MQNFIIFLDHSQRAHHTPLKIGNLVLNWFGIDELAGFEILGIYYLKKISDDMDFWDTDKDKGRKIKLL